MSDAHLAYINASIDTSEKRLGALRKMSEAMEGLPRDEREWCVRTLLGAITQQMIDPMTPPQPQLPPGERPSAAETMSELE